MENQGYFIPNNYYQFIFNISIPPYLDWTATRSLLEKDIKNYLKSQSFEKVMTYIYSNEIHVTALYKPMETNNITAIPLLLIDFVLVAISSLIIAYALKISASSVKKIGDSLTVNISVLAVVFIILLLVASYTGILKKIIK